MRLRLGVPCSWLLAVFSLAGFHRQAEAAPPPNLLVILADDLGYGDLSSFGAMDLQTPNLDALVGAGMRWDRFYANCTVCSPTRASLMTGRYPDLVGVPGVIRTRPEDNWGWFQPGGATLPEALQAGGYATALVGKWHLGLTAPNTPNERGFEFFHGFLGDMMDDYFHHRRHGQNYLRRNAEVITPTGHATELFSEWATAWLREPARQRQPWFLYLAYNAPHTPIQPPEEWLELVRLRSPEMDPARAALVALIEHLDHGIGRVIETLRGTGQWENTLILFTSDNGGQLSVGARNGPLRGGKQDLYEGGLRVPMVAVWPGRIIPGSRSDEVGLTMDLYPTLCAAAGVEVTRPLDGRSLLPVLTGETEQLGNRTLVWMRREGGDRYRGQDYYAVRRDGWKLLQNDPFSPLELYQLDRDPGELTNLVTQETEVLKELSAQLRRHLQAAGAVPWQDPAKSAAAP